MSEDKDKKKLAEEDKRLDFIKVEIRKASVDRGAKKRRSTEAQ